MSKFSSHTQLGDRIHNAGLDYYTFHLHLKKCLNSGSHSTCNITAITLLAGISGITASTQDLLHMLFGFHQRVGCGCRGKLWFMFEYKTCLYFPKGTNNKGLEQAKEYVRINELLLCIIKLSRTGPGSFWWLLKNSAAGMQQHQGGTWIKGLKGTELPEAADSTPTWGETTATSTSAPERPLTTGTAGLLTLEATADGAGCQKGREDAREQLCQGQLPCSAVCSSAPRAALTPPLFTTMSWFSISSLNHSAPLCPSSIERHHPPSHFRTFLVPSEPAVSSHRCSTTTHCLSSSTL